MSVRLYHQRHYACPGRGDGHDCNGIPGDCLRTAVACVVGAAPWTLTHYAQRADWWRAMRMEARERWGQDWACLPLPDGEQLRQGMGGGWQFAPGRHRVVSCGPSPRGAFYHVCVADIVAEEGADDLRIEHVHDPHPLGMGLTAVRELLVPVAMYDPAPMSLVLTPGAAA